VSNDDLSIVVGRLTPEYAILSSWGDNSFMFKTLFDFFEPQLRELGVKGDLTAGKLKWRGIKMHVYQKYNGIRYQLYQRGIAIGKSLDIDLNL